MSYITYEVRVHPNGTKQWFLNGRFHREDGPAVECGNGDKYWYLNGKLHRVDGPAIEYANGTKYWYVEGKRHRLDGPAIEDANGEKHWYFEHQHLSESEWRKRVPSPTIPSCEGKVVEIEGKRYRLTLV